MLKLDLTVSEMCELLEAVPVGANARLLKRKVNLCLDSREAAPGVVFWPLVGEKFDAHAFVEQSMEKGALMSVVNQSRVGELTVPVYVPVDDTTSGLLKLARGYQRRFDVRKIAITGSNGKTTTKEMVKLVLASKYETHATQGNLNNHVGVPMTLFQLKHKHEVAVVEMGTSGIGEIKPLSLATEPHVAVITNVGFSHLEGLGSVENVYKEKASITAGLQKNGTLIVNADDPLLSRMRATKGYKILSFGLRRGMVRPDELHWDENACGRFRLGRTWFQLNVPGTHSVYNALAAIAVGMVMKVPKASIAAALGSFRSANMRMEIRKGCGIQVVADCYNANPSSTRMALETIGNVGGTGRRIAVLGDMLELGTHSRKLHYDIGRIVPEMNFDILVAVGPEAADFRAGAISAGMDASRALHFGNREEAIAFLDAEVRQGDILLVKGSRGMKLEQVVDALLRLEPVFGA